MAEEIFPPNPDFGNGVYRRGIDLVNAPGRIIGGLEDTVHAMRCTISHANGVITGIQPEFVRVPMTTCAGANDPLQALVGLAIATPVSWFFAGGRARLHCTHIYDLAIAMLFHARRDEEHRRYEVEIPDNSGDGPTRVTLKQDGQVSLEWMIGSDGAIMSPPPFVGQKPLRGFSRWATETLDDPTLDRALILQKGFWQSGVRRVLIGQVQGPIRGREEAAKGSCFSYSSPQFEKAARISSWRDFSNGKELLEFRPLPADPADPRPL